MKPKDFIGKKVKYCPGGSMIFGVNEKGNEHLILDVRGWGNIQNLFDTESEAMKFQDEVGRFVADAINEKLSKQ